MNTQKKSAPERVLEALKGRVESLWLRIQEVPEEERPFWRKKYRRAYEIYKRQKLLVLG